MALQAFVGRYQKVGISIYRYIPPCCDTDPQIYAVPTNFNP